MTRRPNVRCTSVAAALAAAVVLASCGGSDEDADPAAAHGYEDGDTIRMIVATDAGGGFDTHARLLQPYLEESLREVTGADVSLVVENMGGAQHRVGTEYVAQAEPDGTTIGYTYDGALVSNAVIQGTDYDPAELSYIANVGDLSAAMVVRSELGLDGFADLVELAEERRVTVGVATDTDITLVRELLAEEGVEAQLEPVSYGSTAEIAAGLLRGEVDAGLSGGSGLLPFVEDNDEIDFLVNLNCSADPALEGVPSITEADVPAVEEICVAVGAASRLVFGPAGMEEATVEALETAVLQAGEDEEFVSQATRAGLYAPLVGADEITTKVGQLVGIYEEYGDLLAPN